MSHKNFVCSNGKHLSLVAQIGAGCFDGDLDLLLSLDADLESLLLGGGTLLFLCIIDEWRFLSRVCSFSGVSPVWG